MRARAAACGLLAAVVVGCAGAPTPRRSEKQPAPPLRLSIEATRGDAARRASTRLVLQGLASAARGAGASALGDYERALQVDATNPHAYLCLARHEIFEGEVTRGLAYLEQAEALFPSDPASDGARAHLVGLRGAAYQRTGRRREAQPLLDAARELSPQIWRDGFLDAAELR